MGQSRGGLSTEIHAAVDALGNPVRLELTPGQASEYGVALMLLDGFSPDAVLGDKGYDSTALRDRNLVERSFLKIKQFRRVATRYERLARNYQSFLCLVSAMIWLA